MRIESHFLKCSSKEVIKLVDIAFMLKIFKIFTSY